MRLEALPPSPGPAKRNASSPEWSAASEARTEVAPSDDARLAGRAEEPDASAKIADKFHSIVAAGIPDGCATISNGPPAGGGNRAAARGAGRADAGGAGRAGAGGAERGVRGADADGVVQAFLPAYFAVQRHQHPLLERGKGELG